jgi:hypothetical protein
MGASTRIRSAALGFSACTCEGCAGRGGGGKRHVKWLVKRKVRASEAREIAASLAGE